MPRLLRHGLPLLVAGTLLAGCLQTFQTPRPLRRFLDALVADKYAEAYRLSQLGEHHRTLKSGSALTGEHFEKVAQRLDVADYRVVDTNESSGRRISKVELKDSKGKTATLTIGVVDGVVEFPTEKTSIYIKGGAAPGVKVDDVPVEILQSVRPLVGLGPLQEAHYFLEITWLRGARELEIPGGPVSEPASITLGGDDEVTIALSHSRDGRSKWEDALVADLKCEGECASNGCSPPREKRLSIDEIAFNNLRLLDPMPKPSDDYAGLPEGGWAIAGDLKDPKGIVVAVGIADFSPHGEVKFQLVCLS